MTTRKVHQPDPGLRRGYRDVEVIGLPNKPDRCPSFARGNVLWCPVHERPLRDCNA